jgi:hypothetical protein
MDSTPPGVDPGLNRGEVRVRKLLAVFALAAGALLAGTARADVSQTPITTGCPAGFEHLSVASLEASGPYRVPRRLDTAGNDNGFVCALALPEARRLAFCGPSCAVPVLFLFGDDDNPAAMRAEVGG